MKDLLRCGREARPAPAGWNLAKTFAQLVVFWSTFLFILPAVVYRIETCLTLDRWRFTDTAWRVPSIVAFTAASALGGWSAAVMAVCGSGTPLPADCPRRLVVAGPYRFVRNPMAIAGLTQGAAVGAFLGSPLVLLYVLVGGPLWNFFVRRWEEADLELRFGSAFNRYREAVRCWVPRLTPYVDRERPGISET